MQAIKMSSLYFAVTTQVYPDREPSCHIWTHRPQSKVTRNSASNLFASRLKRHLDFLERLPLRLRQKESRRNEINHRAARPEEEHRVVSVIAHSRQKHRRYQRGDALVQQQRNTHADGPDAHRHQL